MATLNSHAACVAEWLARRAANLTAAQQVALLDLGFTAVWNTAHQTLGSITLTAVVDRVLSTSAKDFPPLSQTRADFSGISFEAIYANGTTPDQSVAALRSTLIELLRVLGAITAEILTPSLHAALAAVSMPSEATQSTATASPHDEAPTK